MSKLNWNMVNQRTLKTGVSRGVIYPDGQDGFVWNGLTSVSERSSGGEVTKLYADNLPYCTIRSAEHYEATIEAYGYPDAFLPCIGVKDLGNGVYLRQQPRVNFDFCYRTEVYPARGDAPSGYELHLIYGAVAIPSDVSNETIGDSPSAVQHSWDIKTLPHIPEGYKALSSITIHSLRIDRIKIETLEGILFGSDGVPPRMPDPNEVLDIVARLDVERAFIDILSEEGRWIWDTFNFQTSTVPLAIEEEARSRIFYDPEAGTSFVSPSISYHLVSKKSKNRRYLVYVIDEDNPSKVATKAAEQLGMTADSTTKSGNYYYYSYNLYT